MGDKSKIEWTDASWNPVTGCEEVSPGCDHCYAKTFAERWRGTAGHPYEHGFDLTLRPERLDQPLRWRRPRRIFVNSMSDLFHDDVPDDYIAKVFAVMARAHQHTFQVLTKRHGRMKSLLNNFDWRRWMFIYESTLGLHDRKPQPSLPTWPLPNVWLGCSVENQQWADIRIPALLDTPAAVRWLSCEPLLGPVGFSRFLYWRPVGENLTDRPLPPVVARACGLPSIDWVVVGGESGPGARPMHPDWARSIRDQCAGAGVPFFFKQWGNWAALGPLYEQDDDDTDADEARMEAAALEVHGGTEVIELETDGYIPRGHQPGDHRTWLMARLGKKQAGRELDGRTHDEYPAVA